MNIITTQCVRPRQIGATVIIAVSTVVLAGVGCATDETYPDRIPRRTNNRWVDGPLRDKIDRDLTAIRGVVADFLDRQQVHVCELDGSLNAPRAVRQAGARVAYGVSVAGSRAAKKAAGDIREADGDGQKQSARTDEWDPPEPFADSRWATTSPAGVVVAWQCQPIVTPEEIDGVAAEVVGEIYDRELSSQSISPEAVSRLLPVLRDDFEWGLQQVDDAVSAGAAVDQIEASCTRGESPLGQFVRAHAHAKDDRVGSLARRFGGDRPCNNLQALYAKLFRQLNSAVPTDP